MTPHFSLFKENYMYDIVNKHKYIHTHMKVKQN